MINVPGTTSESLGSSGAGRSGLQGGPGVLNGNKSNNCDKDDAASTVYVYMCVCVYMCILYYAYIYIYIYACIYIYIYINMYI